MKTVDMETIRKCYYSLHPEGHWFDRDTMRFFRSRLATVAYCHADGRCFFVTSEKGPSEIRRWSVRVQDNDGQINTVGEFQAYSSRGAADREARRLAREATPDEE